MALQTVGHVRELFLYPVKSMRGVAVSEITCYWYGANGDRKVAFTRAGDESGFPWLTARELPALLQYEPYFVDPASPLSSSIRVKTPDNRVLALEAPELVTELATLADTELSLLKLKRGTFDSMPISIITSDTLNEVRRAAGRSLDVRRFRPNVYIETTSDTGEEKWMDSTLIFGTGEEAARVQVNYQTKRCMVINLDPDSSQADQRVLKAVAATRQSQAGVYASVGRPGAIRVGDEVYLERPGWRQTTWATGI